MFVADDDSVLIVRLLDQTLTSIDGVSVREATEALDRLSTELIHFPYRLLSIASGKISLCLLLIPDYLAIPSVPKNRFLIKTRDFDFPESIEQLGLRWLTSQWKRFHEFWLSYELVQVFLSIRKPKFKRIVFGW